MSTVSLAARVVPLRVERASEDAVLIVVEDAVPHGQVQALMADARAVVVARVRPSVDRGAGELEVLDRRVRRQDDEDALLTRDGASPGAAAAIASHGFAARAPFIRAI